jgi:hypothetical protein
MIHEMTLEGSPPTGVLRLDRVLTVYGPPERAFVDAYIATRAVDDIYFALTLTYPAHEFIIQFKWTGSLSGSDVTACIQDGLIHLFIQPVEQAWTEDFVRSQVYGDIPADQFMTLEEATGLSLEEFYDEFKIIEGSECIHTPAEYWSFIN